MDINSLLLLANLAIAASVLFATFKRTQANTEGGAGLPALRTELENLGRMLREGSESARAAADERARLLREEVARNLSEARKEATSSGEALRDSVVSGIKAYGSDQRESQAKLTDAQNKVVEGLVVSVQTSTQTNEQRLQELRQTLETKLTESAEIMAARLTQFERANVETGHRQSASLTDVLNKLIEANEQRAEKLRETVDTALTTLRLENEAKLEQMRKTVDEQLQNALEKRLGESFGIVADHLKQVAVGLDQMQQLATGFSDIKRVLANVRPRGIWGEAQLEGILADFLAADQFERNVAPNPETRDVVEFAIKLPRQGGAGHYYIPIDSKFPREDFDRLIAAADSADADAVKVAADALAKSVRKCAQDIKHKYICQPYTADFAIMFLPSEGLYAEVARKNGLIESIGREFGVMVAGPSNLMAHLSAVRVGFRSLAIQEQAGEIASILQRVQAEFVKYDAAVEKALKRATSTVSSITELQTRQRQMGRALKGVDMLRAATREDAARLMVDFDSQEPVGSEHEDDEDAA